MAVTLDRPDGQVLGWSLRQPGCRTMKGNGWLEIQEATVCGGVDEDLKGDFRIWMSRVSCG
jgi:hypothetical protein